MRVNVADIKLEPGLHKTVPIAVAVEPFDIGGQTFHFDRPFAGQAEIWNAGDRLLVRANVSGEALVPCSRCLTPFGLPLDVSFEEEFIEGQPGDVDEDDTLADEEREVTFYEGDEIDLSDAVRENLVLELPIKPLCSDECQGLCPTCGSNLNEGTCTCHQEESKPVDSRLAILKDFLEKRKPDSNS